MTRDCFPEVAFLVAVQDGELRHNAKSEPTAIAIRGKAYEAALRNAVALWAEATTSPTSLQRDELAHDKREAANSFFSFVSKHPWEVTSSGVTEWRCELEAHNLKPITVSARLSRLPSFSNERNMLSIKVTHSTKKGPGTIKRALESLVARDILREEEKLSQIRYRFEDPFFARWISMFTAKL